MDVFHGVESARRATFDVGDLMIKYLPEDVKKKNGVFKSEKTEIILKQTGNHHGLNMQASS